MNAFTAYLRAHNTKRATGETQAIYQTTDKYAGTIMALPDELYAPTNLTNSTDASSPTNLTKQPNSRSCFVCGVENEYGLHLEFYETSPGEVTVEYIVPEHFQGYPGVAHGGIVASLVDEVLGRVHMGSDPANPRFMYTARLTVQYRKPVPVGKPIRIFGHAGKSKHRSAASTAEIYGPEGELLVEAEAILVNVPAETHAATDLEALGWKVYP